MSLPCPQPEELSRMLDGELTENRSEALRTHAAGCRTCASELAAQQRLLASIAAPLPDATAAGGVAAVMARLDDADAASAGAEGGGPRARAWGALAMLGAAAAAVVLVATRPAPEADFVPRGSEVAWARKIGVELWALQEQPLRLVSGDRLSPGVAVVASYSNVDPAPGWMLAFAVDARGDVHWLYPAWLDAAADPLAVRLEGSVVQRALPDSVVLEAVPGGALRFVTLVTRTPLRVSDVEAVPLAERSAEALRRRWPGARIDELPVQYTSGPPPGAPP